MLTIRQGDCSSERKQNTTSEQKQNTTCEQCTHRTPSGCLGWQRGDLNFMSHSRLNTYPTLQSRFHLLQNSCSSQEMSWFDAEPPKLHVFVSFLLIYPCTTKWLGPHVLECLSACSVSILKTYTSCTIFTIQLKRTQLQHECKREGSFLHYIWMAVALIPSVHGPTYLGKYSNSNL